MSYVKTTATLLVSILSCCKFSLSVRCFVFFTSFGVTTSLNVCSALSSMSRMNSEQKLLSVLG